VALIVVTGLPASGKTTLATALSSALALPLIRKDHYKELLFDTLGIGDRDWSRRIGQAAIALQYEAMALARDAVVDSALWTGVSEAELLRLRLPIVQVFCECPFELARDRYFKRERSGERHAGFVAEELTVDDFERFRPLTVPLQLDAPLCTVDTTQPVGIAVLATEVLSAVARL